MALSRKYLLRDIVVPLVVGLASLFLALVLLRLFFGPEVQRVDPSVLRELRAIGQVVGERTVTFHQFENTYVDDTYLVVHLGGSAKGDVLDEVGRRLKPNGWDTEEWEPRKLNLVPPRETSTLVTVQPLEMADLVDSDTRGAVMASKLPWDEMVYITLSG